MTTKPLARTLLLIIGAIAFAAPEVARAAKTLCCVNAQGRNVCGDILPQECYGLAYREINDHGMTIRQIDAPLTPEQRLRQAAEVEKKKQADIAAREEKRRNDALLNTYATEQDIDFMRDRALNSAVTAAKEAEAKQVEALKRKTKLEGELEFYKKKPVPDTLKQQIKVNETELKALSVVLAAKKQEIEQVTAHFVKETQRYLELKQGGKKTTAPVSATATPPR